MNVTGTGIAFLEPLQPALACTTHKKQGATAKHGAEVEPSANNLFPRGLDYVTVSRPTELANLTPLNPLTPPHFTGFHKRGKL